MKIDFLKDYFVQNTIFREWRDLALSFMLKLKKLQKRNC